MCLWKAGPWAMLGQRLQRTVWMRKVLFIATLSQASLEGMATSICTPESFQAANKMHKLIPFQDVTSYKHVISCKDQSLDFTNTTTKRYSTYITISSKEGHPSTQSSRNRGLRKPWHQPKMHRVMRPVYGYDGYDFAEALRSCRSPVPLPSPSCARADELRLAPMTPSLRSDLAFWQQLNW